MSYVDDSAWGVTQQSTENAHCVVYAVTGTSSVRRLPEDWGNSPDGASYWIHLLAEDQNCRYLLSKTSTAVVAATAGTGAGATGTTTGGPLIAGVEKPVKVPDGFVYLALIAKTGTTDVCCELRSGPTK